MINGFTFNSWPLISNVLLVLTGSYISISISLPLYQWTIGILETSNTSSPSSFVSWWLGSSFSASKICWEKHKSSKENSFNLPPHLLPIWGYPVHLLSWYFGCAVCALSSHQCLYVCRGCQPLLSAQRHCSYLPPFSWTVIFFSLLGHSYQQHNLLFILLC